MGDSNPEQLLDQLVSTVDLTEYEIVAYLTVIEHGSITATKIAELTSVPKPRIYDTLRTLDKKDLIELRESRPMRAVARDPEEVFGSVADTLDALTGALKNRYTTPSRDNEAAYLIRSKNSIRRRFRAVLESAEYELVVACTPDLLRECREVLDAAVDSNTAVDIVLSPADAAPDPETFPYETVATNARGRFGCTTPILAIADGNYAIFSTPRVFDTEHDDQYAIVVNRSELSFLLYGFFETILWSTAEVPLCQAEYDDGLPKKYASVRRCVQDINQLDEPLRADIEGRRVPTGERVSVAGRVMEANISPDRTVASIAIETDDGERLTVGGRVAAYEDIEAHLIRLEYAGGD
jgi:sugar-specific transcriptional regulator TrmB